MIADENDANTGGEEEISWEDAFEEAAQGNAPADEAVHEAAPPDASRAASAVDGANEEEEIHVDIDFLLDLPLNLTVEVGRKRILVNEMLQIGQGSVIPLEKDVGEPFEVYVNGKLMAYGEVVVVNEKFGVRLTDVIDPKDRIRNLA